jgi:DNA-binding transcriptional LysR family regulator
MELYQLRTFTTVAELGHLTRAAERLHVSQPAVSAQLKALEDELCVTLFERTPAGMVLTKAGRALRAQAERVLAAAQDLRNTAGSFAGATAGRLRVGSVSDPDFIRIGEVLALAVERYPLLEVEVRHEMSGAALAAVEAGDLDASFYFGDLHLPAVAGFRLTETVYRVAAPAAWKDRVAGAAWSELAAMPWVLTPPTSTHNHLVTDLFAKHGVTPTRVVEADAQAVLENLVVSGVGLSLVLEERARVREAAGELYVLDHARLTTSLWFIYRTEREHDPAITALIDVVQNVWPSRATGARAAPLSKRRRVGLAAEKRS